MKKIFNKIGQALQLVLAAPVKLPGKVGNVLKYLALGLGIVETVLDEAKSQPKVNDKVAPSEENGKTLTHEAADRKTAPEKASGKPTSGWDNHKSPSEGTVDNNAVKDSVDGTVERSVDNESE